MHLQRPKIEQQKKKGYRLIRPAMSRVRFLTPSGDGKLVFEAGDDLRKKVEGIRGSTILLIAPEQDKFIETLEYYFENAGWDIEVHTSVDDAIEQLESGKAFLVMVDAGLPDHQRFATALKTSRETATVPLILLHPDEVSAKQPKDLCVVGDEAVSQPFEFRKLLDLADALIQQAAEGELIYRQQLNLRLPTDEKLIEQALDHVHKLFEDSGLTEEEQVAMAAAFREAVLNAAQHGNKYKREKNVNIQYLLEKDKVTVRVRDQGGGFDHSMYLKSREGANAANLARERHKKGRMGGLGILLMLRCCDKLEYNDEGNQLTLMKRLKPNAEPVAAATS